MFHQITHYRSPRVSGRGPWGPSTTNMVWSSVAARRAMSARVSDRGPWEDPRRRTWFKKKFGGCSYGNSRDWFARMVLRMVKGKRGLERVLIMSWMCYLTWVWASRIISFFFWKSVKKPDNNFSQADQVFYQLFENLIFQNKKTLFKNI